MIRNAQRLMHRTKILCTVGPAIASREKLRAVLQAGASAFRLNMSHGSYEMHARSIALIRSLEEELGTVIPIVVDIQGPKLRVGDLPDGEVLLRPGSTVSFASIRKWQELGKPADVIPLQFPTLAQDVKPGNVLLFDDGLLQVRVEEVRNGVVKAVVVDGGILKSRKGINVPGTALTLPAFTQKDRRDVRFALEHYCDYIAISFVRSAKDVQAVRRYIQRQQPVLEPWLIAKIEKPEAVNNIEEIMHVSDGVMIARGDLGVEIPAAEVPIVQKRIIRMCNERAKLVITATQMLESMVHNPRPTRAEASDVANAVLDGTDVVMLSAETSVGAYPVEAVAYMRMICSAAEREIATFHPSADLKVLSAKDQRPIAIAKAAVAIARNMPIAALAILTYSGETLRQVAAQRPQAALFAVTYDPYVARRVKLLWGVIPLLFPKFQSTDEAIELIKERLSKEFFPKGSRVVITLGRPLQKKVRTNMIAIEQL